MPGILVNTSHISVTRRVLLRRGHFFPLRLKVRCCSVHETQVSTQLNKFTVFAAYIDLYWTEADSVSSYYNLSLFETGEDTFGCNLYEEGKSSENETWIL